MSEPDLKPCPLLTNQSLLWLVQLCTGFHGVKAGQNLIKSDIQNSALQGTELSGPNLAKHLMHICDFKGITLMLKVEHVLK